MATMHTFQVFLNHPLARVPARAEEGAAGYDLSSVEDVVIEGNSQAIINTGLIVQFPSDCYARIAPRSGLAAKHSIDVLAGVVDSSYRGEIKVILVNHSPKSFHVHAGDRVAQLIYERIYTPVLEVVSSKDDLDVTTRGAGGFGSSGMS